MNRIMKRIASAAFAALMTMSLAVSAFADPMGATGPSSVEDATIDTSATGSITIYKYDMTQAEKDGVWVVDDYKSTGEYDSDVNETLGSYAVLANGENEQDLGNGETSYGYAIKGVEFTYLKVADFRTYSENEDGVEKIILLYGIKPGDELLDILELSADDRYVLADDDTQAMYYFESDTLIDALSNIMQDSTRTAKKSALENYITSNGGTTMAETDAYGMTTVSGLPLGLYLIVETAVPEMVTCTCAPFFVSVPMTAVTGGLKDSEGNYTRNTDGGNRWVYDITLYPKNETGIPSLEKTVRESQADTGKNDASTSDIYDGYDHNATGSDGDVMEYQIISTLPTITSEATELTMYTYVDVIEYGLEYNKSAGVTIEIFEDADCTNKVTTWSMGNQFEVTYGDSGRTEDGVTVTGTNKMTITMTDAGLAEINSYSSTAHPQTTTRVGFSDWTMRITYSCTIDSSAEVVYGDGGNTNDVYLMWQRSNMDYYDTLIDDCHVYTYGLDLTKQFSDGNGDMTMVEFVLHNDTDDYYVQAEYNEEEQVYYVVDSYETVDSNTTDAAPSYAHSCAEEYATHFVPTEEGKIIIKGLEDDTYTMTEVRTSDGYTLLKDDIEIVISQTETEDDCTYYGYDTIGVIQNDARWDSPDTRPFGQSALSHKLLTASATVDGNAVTMESVAESANALAPLTVLNTRGFTLPQTGSNGNWLYPVIGVSAILLAGFVIVLVLKKKENDDDAQQKNVG